MLIKESKDVVEQVMSRLRKRSGYRGRWHLTDLLRCPRVTYWFYTGEKPQWSDALILRFTRGKAHHGLLEVFPLKEIKREKDGVKMSIDMIGSRVTEIFTTTVSTNKVKDEVDVPSVFPYKVKQLMGYTYACDERAGDLLVFYLFGDYSRFTETPFGLAYTGLQPCLQAWTLYFEEDEQRELWDFVLSRKALLEQCLAKKKCPEEIGEEWECRSCPFAWKCPDAKYIEGVDAKRVYETLRQLEETVEKLKERKECSTK